MVTAGFVLLTMSSSTQGVISQSPDLTDTFGALFIGVIFAAILFGTTNVQAFIYFQTHNGTGLTLYKLAVVLFWMLDALHLALIIHCVYYYLVINYGNPSALGRIAWCFKLQVAVDVFIISGVLSLYAHRIWLVSKGRSRALLAMMGIMVILGSGVSVALIWVVYQCREFTDLLKYKWAVYMVLSTIAFVDVVIAASLCYLLANSRTGFTGTDSLLTKLMTYIISTGCLTSVTSIAAMITCAAMPGNFIFISIEFVIAQLYVNSYLALLNARHYLRPSGPDNFSSLELRAHSSSPYSKESTVEKMRTSAKNVFKHSYDDSDDLYPIRPDQAVMRPIAVTVDVTSFSSV